jgi:hypothetical protein
MQLADKFTPATSRFQERLSDSRAQPGLATATRFAIQQYRLAVSRGRPLPIDFGATGEKLSQHAAKKPCRPGRSAIASAVIHNEGNYKPGRGDSR